MDLLKFETAMAVVLYSMAGAIALWSLCTALDGVLSAVRRYRGR